MSIPEPGAPAELILWRAYVPRWAYLPLSGDGAARYGGRWNAIGQPCLYSACELSTAWAEYNQGFVQHPALIAQLGVTNIRLFDLTILAGIDSAGVTSGIHHIAWRSELDAGVVPATHLLAQQIRKAGWDGLIYPSFMSPGGRCVAMWQWNASSGGPKIVVVDPEQHLPKDGRFLDLTGARAAA